MRTPLIIIGSAGSGKTTLTLEKLKQLKGDVLYTTLSVELLQCRDKILRDINNKTSRSMHTAVLVPRDEDKQEAAKYFSTPLLLSIQEAKGLEYDNVVLFNFVSFYRDEFNKITENVSEADLESMLTYSRAKDKRDKSLEEYKFFINALYVAMTRAIEAEKALF